MKLFEIEDQIEEIFARHVDEHGVIDEEAIAPLEALELERDKLAVHLARYHKGELAEAAAVDAVVQGLLSRRDTHKRRAEWIRTYMESHLPEGFGISDPTVIVKTTRSEACRVIDEDNLTDVPAELVIEKLMRRVDKAAALKRLKKGEQIPGLELEKRSKLTIK